MHVYSGMWFKGKYVWREKQLELTAWDFFCVFWNVCNGMGGTIEAPFSSDSFCHEFWRRLGPWCQGGVPLTLTPAETNFLYNQNDSFKVTVDIPANWNLFTFLLTKTDCTILIHIFHFKYVNLLGYKIPSLNKRQSRVYLAQKYSPALWKKKKKRERRIAPAVGGGAWQSADLDMTAPSSIQTFSSRPPVQGSRSQRLSQHLCTSRTHSPSLFSYLFSNIQNQPTRDWNRITKIILFEGGKSSIGFFFFKLLRLLK